MASHSFAYLAADDKDRKALASLEQAISSDAALSGPALTSLGERWGSRERCLLSYLRNSDVKFDSAKAVKRLKASLSFWSDSGLDRESDVKGQLTRHPLNAVWPMAYPMVAPDGCPVQYARVAAVKPSQLTQSEEGLRRYVVLWLARALEVRHARSIVARDRANHHIDLRANAICCLAASGRSGAHPALQGDLRRVRLHGRVAGPLGLQRAAHAWPVHVTRRGALS